MSTDNPYASPIGSQSAQREAPQLEVPQSVSYRLSQEEAGEILAHLSLNNPVYERHVRRRQRAFIGIGLLFVVGGVLAGMAGYRLLLWLFPAYSLLLFYLALRLPALTRKRAAKLAIETQSQEKFSWIEKKLDVRLESEGIFSEDEDGYRFRKWSKIHDIESNPKMLYLYYESTSALPVPSRAFYDEAAFEAFCALATRLWQDADLSSGVTSSG